MAVETSVKNQVCQKCGAEIRPGALFCYSCGTAVAPNPADSENNAGDERDNVLSERRAAFEQNREGKNLARESIAESVKQAEKLIDKPFESLSKPENKTLEVERAKTKSKTPIAEREAVLKTAAAAVVRRDAKAARRKNVEYVWEEPRGSVNILFFAAAIILTLFAVGALLAMLYLR